LLQKKPQKQKLLTKLKSALSSSRDFEYSKLGGDSFHNPQRVISSAARNLLCLKLRFLAALEMTYFITESQSRGSVCCYVFDGFAPPLQKQPAANSRI
jgi:hypothetical protein